jgi:hypothetical protein
MQDSCATNSEQQNIVVVVERPYTSIGQVRTCTALACFWAVYFTAGLEVQRIASTDREKVFHTVVRDWLGASRAPAERNGKKVAPTVLNDSLGKNTRDTLSLKMRIRRQPKRPAKACIKVRGVGCTPAAPLPQPPGKRKRETWLKILAAGRVASALAEPRVQTSQRWGTRVVERACGLGFVSAFIRQAKPG